MRVRALSQRLSPRLTIGGQHTYPQSISTKVEVNGWGEQQQQPTTRSSLPNKDKMIYIN